MNDLVMSELTEAVAIAASKTDFPAVYIQGATSPDSPLLRKAIEQLEQAAYEIGEGLAVASTPRINRARLAMEKTLKEIRECIEAFK